MYYLETGNAKQTRFRNAVLLALAVHAALILSVSFSASNAKSYKTPQIEVTLVSQPSATASEQARQIAQANQEGSGDESDTNEISTRSNLQADTPFVQQAQPQAPQKQIDQQRTAVATKAMARHSVTSEKMDDEQEENKLEGVNPEFEQLSLEVASLKAELDDVTRTSAEQPRVRRLTATSAKKSVDAAYLLDWRRRLEAVGNQYYPEASIRYGMYGDLRMLVVIRADGSLEDIQVLTSSGYAVLDEAAIKIVRMAAPYAPFPPELKATTDKLEIVRTWYFQENQLSSPSEMP
jgi:periplasmic protein TonB